MASREYTLAVGTDLIDAAGNGWQIGGIKIDNPSGSWLHVGGAINAYVPPYTLGWATPIQPTQTTVTVRYVDSPSGTPSELIGSPVTVTVSDTLVLPNPGFASGAVQAQSPSGAALRLATLTLATANEAGTTTTLVTPASGNRIVPVSFTAAQIASGAPTSQTYFGLVSVRVVSGVGATLLPLMAISPESPESTKDFPPGTKLAVGDVLRVRGQTFAGGGRMDFAASLLYYEQAG